MDNKTIGKIIRAARIKKKLSQQALADLTGYNNRSSICEIEKGKARIKNAPQFAAALNVDVRLLTT